MMSNKYFVLEGRERTHYVPYEKTVHEHRAPTDESIRLYKEMKEKAEQSVLDSFELENNLVNARVVVCKSAEYFNQKLQVHYKTMINGHEFTGVVKVEDTLSRDAMVEKIVSELSKHIAIEILTNMPNNEMAILMSRGKYL
jgi:hypothetical protein